MEITSEQVLQLLTRITHPATGKNIVSMGMVQDLTIEAENIGFVLKFQSFNDPLKSSLKNACEQLLKDELKNKYQVKVILQAPVRPIKPVPEKPLSTVKNIIAISSGKGGVGKSTVAANIAVAFAKTGAKTGLIDADIFGPSIPKMLGVEGQRPEMAEINGKEKIMPIEKFGVKILSIGFFVNPSDATIWRGPMASNALKQLMADGHWDGLDYLFLDLPPGTSDIHITISQDIKLTGAVIVSTPQDVALADVVKGINMFRNKGLNVPVLGIIENMAWFTPEELPDNKYYIFGKGGCEKLSKEMNVPLLGQIPIIQSVREDSDNGTPAVLRKDKVAEYFKNIAETIRTEALKASIS
ncbi:MAG: Mrp/NBP35 family ATP-binding protein [Bacteroidales bacterium]|nr:Mrp/NBP35 family ATP-binding protein [Bacteroidales bacterium]